MNKKICTFCFLHILFKQDQVTLFIRQNLYFTHNLCSIDEAHEMFFNTGLNLIIPVKTEIRE
jgi:hypothetical protein